MAAEEPESFDLSSVKLFASGADAMPPPLIERFRKLGCAVKSPRGKLLFTSAFAEIYGMVELSGPAILKVTPPEPFEDAPIRSRVRRSRIAPRLTNVRARLRENIRALAGRREDERAALGIPIPPYRAKIVDDNGKTVRPGVVGELVLKGPGVTKGYDADPQATAKTTQDGWLRTGDLAWKNRLGFIAFATRKKDVIKHGGYSVFPAEVEAQMMTHPRVAEAVVFGIPHATKGAQPAAAVVVKGNVTVEELLEWCRANIASYKAPRVIAIVKADEIPRNANKKVLKDDLKKLLSERGLL
jgi:acyl-CoA synthetase (AMP-forming)/AMP-acid ligase II